MNPFGLRHFHANACGTKPRDELTVARLVQPAPRRGGQHRTDLVRGLERLERRRLEGVHRSERARQHLRAALADVADPEPVDESPEVVRLAARDLLDDLRGVLVAEPPLDRLALALGRAGQRRQLIGRQVIDVGVVANEAARR